MRRIWNALTIPAHRSTHEALIALMLFWLACSLLAIIWQAEVIQYQRDLIRDLWFDLRAR